MKDDGYSDVETCPAMTLRGLGTEPVWRVQVWGRR